MRSIVIVAVAAMLAAGSAHADLVVSNGATSNVQCTAGACTATAADAVLNIRDLKLALLDGDLAVSAGSDAADIVVKGKLKWANPHKLTLSAFRSVIFADAVTVEGSGGVAIAPNAGGSGGDLVFKDKGSLAFWDLASSLVIAGAGYTLVGDVDGLAGAVATDPSGHYALARSFDAQGASYVTAAVPTVIKGTFNGLGNTIANVEIELHKNGTRVGFFGTIYGGAVVRDFTLQNVVITHRDTVNNDVGALAGVSQGLVSNVTIQGGSVDGRSSNLRFAPNVGGMIGFNAGGGIVSRSRVLGTLVFGSLTTGGMVGNDFGDIQRSHAEAVVSGGIGSTAGGLVGELNGRLLLSSSGGSVSVVPNSKGSDHFERTGGLAGTASGRIDRCWSTATVEGGSGAEGHGDNYSRAEAGGLVGNADLVSITNSYARGPVSVLDGADRVRIGGLIGEAFDNTIEHAYSAGLVTCNGCTNQTVGGFIADDSVERTEMSYWDTEASGQAAGCGEGDCTDVSGLTTGQFKSGLPGGFDPAIWAQSPTINDGYPYLIANPPQ